MTGSFASLSTWNSFLACAMARAISSLVADLTKLPSGKELRNGGKSIDGIVQKIGNLLVFNWFSFSCSSQGNSQDHPECESLHFQYFFCVSRFF
jgi:hypothetical protein